MNLHFHELKSTSRESSPTQDGPSPGEIHIWAHAITHADPFIGHARFVLSAEELEKASKYHFEKDKRAYEAGHVFIRRVLSRYTQIDPVSLEITVNDRNKPQLANSPFPIHFNISHSENLILLAISFDGEVGADTEFILPDFDTDGFAEANYHPNELAQFQAVSGTAQTDLFYKIWTLKEAFLKLTGEGVNDHLKDLDFSGKNSSIKHSKGSPKELNLYSWKRKDDYICSLAADIAPAKLKFYDSALIEPIVNEDF